MKVFRSLAELASAALGPTVATIGNFDGVHRGHRQILSELRTRGLMRDQRTLAITFDPHPVRHLRPDAPHTLITPLAYKLELLAETGIDATLVLRFDAALASLSCDAFASTILREAAHASEVHEGESFRFGRHAEGSIGTLQRLGAELGFSVRIFEPHLLRGSVVSSSRIRRLLAAGEVSQARALLGRPFAIDSTPASGRGYGTRFAVPTINLAPYAELLPAHGVYVTTLRVAGETFEAVTNIGNRPTFGADSFAVESHLLNFHPIALDESTPLRLTFLKRLRGEQVWPSPEALRAQIGRDVARASRFFALCG
jgi:riboflavin kinase/FMN adenylyltransferase